MLAFGQIPLIFIAVMALRKKGILNFFLFFFFILVMALQKFRHIKLVSKISKKVFMLGT